MGGGGVQRTTVSSAVIQRRSIADDDDDDETVGCFGCCLGHDSPRETPTHIPDDDKSVID